MRQKRRAAKFHAESTSYHAEINFLGMFRELWRFLLFDPFGRQLSISVKSRGQGKFNTNNYQSDRNLAVAVGEFEGTTPSL